MRNIIRLTVAIALIFAVIAGILMCQRRTQPGLPSETVSAVGEINRMEVFWQNRRILLKQVPPNQDPTRDKSLHDLNNPVWVIESIDDSPPINPRARQNFVAKLIDAIKGLANRPLRDVEVLDPEQAPSVGISSPQLALNFAWEGGEGSFLFGNPQPGGRRIYVFIPKGPRLVAATTSLPTLLQGKTILDLQDRRLTTFETDDVEELTTIGNCKSVDLQRDGGQWIVRAGTLSVGAVDDWLDQLLATQYEEDLPNAMPPTGTPLCRIEIKGRLGRAETVALYQAAGGLLHTNSMIPGVHRLSAVPVLIPSR